MNKKKILIIDDDLVVVEQVKAILEKEGCECFALMSGEGVHDILKSNQIDLIILDLMLPDTHGFEICKKIKRDKGFSTIPIIMLTSESDTTDKIIGFELGVDDYIVKPFDRREFVLRIKAILSRRESGDGPENILRVNGIVVNVDAHKVFIKEEEVKLTALEFRLLTALIARKGNVLTRDGLLSDVWGATSSVDTRRVDEHIKRLRKKLKNAGSIIETVRGMGYRIKNID